MRLLTSAGSLLIVSFNALGARSPTQAFHDERNIILRPAKSLGGRSVRIAALAQTHQHLETKAIKQYIKYISIIDWPLALSQNAEKADINAGAMN